MTPYIRNLYLWAQGIRWLWSRNVTWTHGHRVSGLTEAEVIRYKGDWTPLKFLFPYCTTYLLGTLAGYGVVSLSRAWADRSEWTHPNGRKLHPFATFMTRLLDWGFPGSAHGRHTGPRLWGSVNLRAR